MTYRTVREKLADQRSAEIRDQALERLHEIREAIGCPSCKDAEENPLSGHFHAKCLECSARAIAGGPTFYEAAKAASGGRPMPADYRELLRSVFGEGWRDGHEKAKGWAEKMRNARAVA